MGFTEAFFLMFMLSIGVMIPSPAGTGSIHYFVSFALTNIFLSNPNESLVFATIVHGVAPANRHKDPNWEDINDGRWFYSLYTNESDEIKNRHTAHAAAKDEVKIDNDLLFPPQN